MKTSSRLDEIKDRKGPTRALDPKHALALAESIQTVGLLQPMVVDQHGRLLAGRHRWEALWLLLADSEKERVSHWQKKTCAASPDAADDPALLRRVRALAAPKGLSKARVPIRTVEVTSRQANLQRVLAEIAENEKRRSYRPEDISLIIERLRAAGYVDRPGRPRKGEKSLKVELQHVLGKSLRTVQRILAEEARSNRGRPRLSDRGVRRTLVVSVDPELDDAVRAAAEARGVSIAELCRELLREGLARRSKTRRRP